MLAAPRLDLVEVVDEVVDGEGAVEDAAGRALVQVGLRPGAGEPDPVHEHADAVDAEPDQDVDQDVRLAALLRAGRCAHRLVVLTEGNSSS